VIFGRTKNTAQVEEPDLMEQIDVAEEFSDEADEFDEEEVEDRHDAVAESTDDETEAEAEDEDEGMDEWQTLDASQDWRYDGPFDIDEVDLDADSVQRLDFGTLVITPFDGMQLQLQLNQQTKTVQAILITHEQSAIEVALFAAPGHTSILPEVREDMLDGTRKAGGKGWLVEGPFGTEIRRVLPLTTKEGEKVEHRSRTWLAEGPRWLLRGVVMGLAAQTEGTEGQAELLYEFFCNLVVRRGDDPRAPGDLIPMTVPEALLAAGQQAQAAAQQAQSQG
jgi:hypothetical protein